MKQRILIVDDIPEVIGFMKDALANTYDIVTATTVSEGLAVLERGGVDLVVTDMATPETNSEELLCTIKERGSEMPVLIATADASVENVIRLMRQGACDVIEKPFAADTLRHMIGKALEVVSLRRENRTLQAQLGDRRNENVLIGNSVVLQHVREKARLVAGTAATILITGESGTGKEVVAHEIHRLSDRGDKALVRINCAMVPDTLLERELFGYEKNDNTGAFQSDPGKLELANNGTILIDEIGEMNHTIQARLLRVIQEGEFDRVGGSRPIRVNVRIIATTNRDLREDIRRGRFREDLYYRLNVAPLDMPPLRDRREDIPLLISHFVDLFSRKNKKDPIRLTNNALQKLVGAYWKGNVRQLQNEIERAVIVRSGMTLDAEYFQFESDRDEQMSRVEQTFRFGSVRDMERLMIMNRLRENEENRTRSAETLDISVRTLRNKLNEYNVPRKHQGGVPAEMSAFAGR